MGYRFRKRVKVAPGVYITMKEQDTALSDGFTYEDRTRTGRSKSIQTKPGRPATLRMSGPAAAPRLDSSISWIYGRKLELGFFRRLVAAAEDEALIDGCKRLLMNNEKAALKRFESVEDSPDCAFLAGVVALKRLDYFAAVKHLRSALKSKRSLGKRLGKLGIVALLSIDLTPEIKAHVLAGERGALLALIEAYQGIQRVNEAIRVCRQLFKLEPTDIYVALSLVELLMEFRKADKNELQQVLDMTEGVDNETEAHAVLLLYRARALMMTGELEESRDLLTKLLRKKKGRSLEVLHTIRYERAGVYALLDEPRREQSDLEDLYAENPDFKDVAKRLGYSS